jgi:hypothetical protein
MITLRTVKKAGQYKNILEFFILDRLDIELYTNLYIKVYTI